MKDWIELSGIISGNYAMIKFIILFLIVLLFIGCGFIKSNMQPVVTFVITGEQKTDYESIILSLAPKIASDHKLGYSKKISKYAGVTIQASQNGWLYAHGVVAGDGADFNIWITDNKITTSIGGLLDDQRVHELIEEWQKSLDSADVKYMKVVRQPYLNNKVTPKDNPSWKAMDS